jgi:HEAT repeat protein
VLSFCLKGESVSLDDTLIDGLLSALRDETTFGSLLDRLQERADAEGTSLSARVAALFQLLKAALAAVDARGESSRDQVLDTVAQASGHLTPDMILALIAQRDASRAEDGQLAASILDRMTDTSVASFVARSVTAERGATARLAHAFEALVPDPTKKSSLLEMARAETAAGELGQDPQFEDLWEDATRTMLTTYSDEGFVSAEYARELTAARTQAVEVERLSDDPPDRIAAWLATVSETAVQALDLHITVDLLVIEHDDTAWESIALLAVGEIDRRMLVGDFAAALDLATATTAPIGANHPTRSAIAQRVVGSWVAGGFPRQVVSQLRKSSEADVAAIGRLCHLAGAGLIRPLAEALANEDHVPTIRRLKELLIGFGPAGRQAIEPLKASTNPAVRRTAIDLLRLFGGAEALRELTTMLTDADPQVQQDAVKAIVQIGTKDAYAILERACQSDAATRDTIVRELVSLRDTKAIPPLCYVLTTTQPSRRTATLHESIIEALASLRAHPDSTSALRQALDRGSWLAPLRTTRLREAAARGLRRLGSDDARAALEDAVRTGNRQVRRIAGVELAAMPHGGTRS